MRSTKIIATLGPSTDGPQLAKLFGAGVDVFRVNASHGDWSQHSTRIAGVRSLAAEHGRHTGILLDLQGPKIRLGEFPGGSCEVETGARFTITTDSVEGNRERASTNYPYFALDVKPGDTVLLADGSVELKAIESHEKAVHFEVVDGGTIGSNKGINLPGVALRTPAMTAKDERDLDRGLAEGVDFVALSFVRTAADLERLRRFLDLRQRHLPIIAKIEKPEGWQNLDDILDRCDGVMVARGDLGVEMALEKVPFIQKRIIALAREKGKFVITATQMLESMIENPYPTRAEVSDIANAICDGSDAVMLSGETSIGKDPGRAARTMARVSEETESWLRPQGFPEPLPPLTPSNAEIVAAAAYQAARSAGVAAIVVFTASGASARLISRFRPPVPIYAFTPSDAVARQMALSFGVVPTLAPKVATTEEMLLQMEEILVASGKLQAGDNVVFVSGQPIGAVGSTNLIKLHRLQR